MKFLQVNYSRAISKDDPDQAAALRKAATKIAGVPGLLWKVWIYDDVERIAGGMYLFESDETARAWAEGPMVPALSSHAGVGNIEYRLFDVDKELSEVTRGLPPA